MTYKQKLLMGLLVIGAFGLALTMVFAPRVKALDISGAPAAPNFTHHEPDQWVNSVPLTLTDLRGRVVLLDFWTFDCWNCYRSFPWLKSVEQRFADQAFTVIGVHTPEFEHERARANVVKKVKEFGLDHPVMIDNDFSYWRAMNNRYWPTFYLIDKQGRVRAVYIGETHKGEKRAKAIENRIIDLLKEESS